MKNLKTIIGVCVFILVAICFSNNVFAANITIEDTNIYDGQTQYYKVNGDMLTSTDASSQDYNIRFDKENNKLYLNNYNTTKSMYLNVDNLEVILEGKNIIQGDDFNAIDTNENIIFSGEGSLKVSATGNGIKSSKKITINNCNITAHGENYNGIEAYQIEINESIVTVSGRYSGIHARPDFEIGDDCYFKMTGGNLYTEGVISSAVNASPEYKNCLVVSKEGEKESTLKVYGNATLLQDLTINSSINISENDTLKIPEGVTLKLKNKDLLNLEGNIILNGKMFAGDIEYHNILIQTSDNGKISTTSYIGLTGDEIELSIQADENYEVDTLKYINNNTKEEIIIKDSKFIMPDYDITVNVSFKEISKEIEDNQNLDLNPPTGDNIIVSILVLTLSLTGIYAFKLKRNNKYN